jgi:hypothetical protein
MLALPGSLCFYATIFLGIREKLLPFSSKITYGKIGYKAGCCAIALR